MKTCRSRRISEAEISMPPLTFRPLPSELALWRAADEERLRREAATRAENMREWIGWHRHLSKVYSRLAEEHGHRAEELERAS